MQATELADENLRCVKRFNEMLEEDKIFDPTIMARTASPPSFFFSSS